MSWGRINHPSEMVKIDDEIEVMILHIDHEKEKIALGLKQKSASPWDNVADEVPGRLGVKGTVVNVMSYGAFVKLEDGIEGPGAHQRDVAGPSAISHPSELVHIGDEVEVVVLDINKEKQEISLGMKQTQSNPWDKVADQLPAGRARQGHASATSPTTARSSRSKKASTACCTSATCRGPARSATPARWSRRARRSSARCVSVDQERRRIALGLKQLDDDPWATDIPNRYQPGQLVKGKVTKITNFGVFVGLEDGLEGLLHISELADHKVENPEDVVKVGDEIEVKILRVDADERKIGLSRKRVEWAEDDLGG